MAQSKKEQKLIERLRNKYRLVVMHDETFELKSSLKLSMLNVFIALSTILVVMTAIIVSIIAFTPIKNYIVGYDKVNTTRKLLQLEQTTDSLMVALNHQNLYFDNMRNLLQGKVDSTVSPLEKSSADYGELDIDKVSEEDKMLRAQVEMEDYFTITNKEKELNEKTGIHDYHFFAPLSGTITSGFDPDDGHFGIDIVAKKNTPIKNVLDGTVIDSYWSVETGNVIAVQHANDLISFYKHNSVILKKVGNFVRAGDAIAIIGNTGELSSGPHLHFELWHERVALNPTEFISFN